MIKNCFKCWLTNTVVCNAQSVPANRFTSYVSTTNKEKDIIKLEVKSFHLFRSMCPKTSAIKRSSPCGNCSNIENHEQVYIAHIGNGRKTYAYMLLQTLTVNLLAPFQVNEWWDSRFFSKLDDSLWQIWLGCPGVLFSNNCPTKGFLLPLTRGTTIFYLKRSKSKFLFGLLESPTR